MSSSAAVLAVFLAAVRVVTHLTKSNLCVCGGRVYRGWNSFRDTVHHDREGMVVGT